VICENRQSHSSAKIATLRIATGRTARVRAKGRPVNQIDQIREDMALAGMSQQELADAIGKSFHSINRLLKGARALKADEAEQIRLVVSQRLAGLEGQDALEARQPGSAPGTADRTSHSGGTGSGTGSRPWAGFVPLYGFSLTAHGPALRLEPASRVGIVPAHPAQAHTERGFAVEVVDESMAPRHGPGELVYAVRGLAPRRGHDVVVELADGTSLIRKFQGMDSAGVTVEQYTPSRKQTYRLPDVRGLHAVVGTGQR
jgi:hypothetical protein